jgi:hypothetical protein
MKFSLNFSIGATLAGKLPNRPLILKITVLALPRASLLQESPSNKAPGLSLARALTITD